MSENRKLAEDWIRADRERKGDEPSIQALTRVLDSIQADGAKAQREATRNLLEAHECKEHPDSYCPCIVSALSALAGLKGEGL
jgi:hypothetical protein